MGENGSNKSPASAPPTLVCSWFYLPAHSPTPTAVQSAPTSTWPTSCMLFLLSCRWFYSVVFQPMDKVVQTYWSNLGPIKPSFLVSCPNVQIFLSSLHLFVVGGCFCLFLTGAGWDQLAAFQSKASGLPTIAKMLMQSLQFSPLSLLQLHHYTIAQFQESTLFT